MDTKFSVIVVFIFFVSTTFSISQAQDSVSDHFGYAKTYVGLQAGWGKAFSLGLPDKAMAEMQNILHFCRSLVSV